MKKILTIKQASFKILLGGEHRSVKTFMPLVENFVEQMPELMPDVWDIIEPFKRPFTIDNIRKTWTDWENSYVQRFHDRYIPNPKLSKQTNWSGVSLDFFWKRKLAPKAWGGFSRLFWSDDCTRHAYVFMDVDVKRSYEEKIIEHLKQTSILFNGHYGYFDSMTPEYEEVARANETRSVGISVYSHRLQKKLPDIFWCQVFGAPA